MFQHLTIAPAKSRARCEEKAKNEYDGKMCLIVDGVRCSIVVETEEQLLTVAEELVNAAKAKGVKDISLLLSGGKAAIGDYVLVRLKNRFKHPLFNGYRVRSFAGAAHLTFNST